MNRREKTLLRSLKRVTDFLEGICIAHGPAAAAFTRQQLSEIALARSVVKKAKAEDRPPTAHPTRRR